MKRNLEWAPMAGWHEALGLKLHGCCDCGLVHRVEWKVVDGKLLWRWVRDLKATRTVRRKRMYKR